MRQIASFIVTAALSLALGLPWPAEAGESTEVELARAASGPGQIAIIVGATALPLLSNEEDAANEAWRTADGIVSAWLIAQGVQQIVHAERPDGSSDDSFPSGHATAAFAAATMAADYKPHQAPYWYSAAALIAWSRVRLKRHRTEDVIAGALLGFGVAKLEQSLPRGLLLSPFIDADGGGGVKAVWQF